MSMSKYDLFRTKTNNATECSKKYDFNFTMNGSMATTVFALRLNKELQAGLIINDEEGPDDVIIYTARASGCSCEGLCKGDYFRWRNKIYFVYEDIDLVRETNYIKQRAYECNVEIKIDNSTYWGYFISSLTKYIGDSTKKDVVLVDGEKPILILPHFDWIEIGLRIHFGGKSWSIVDNDLITNKGIAYLSLDRDFDQITAAPKTQPNEDIELANDELPVNTEIEVDTMGGYFKSTPQVEIVSRQSTSVKFIIPYGIDKLTIETKDSNNEIAAKVYKVVIV